MKGPWALRSYVLLVCVAATATAMADDALSRQPPRRTENVIVVTWDGFRWQELFTGADAALLDEKAGGVKDLRGLRRRYWRASHEERREVLLPFVWGTIAKRGQIFGDPSRKAAARCTNGMKFSYPGYHELFCGFAEPRIDSNGKHDNPNLSVLEFLNAQLPYRGRVAAVCTWDVFASIFRSGTNGLKVHTGWSPIADEPLTDRQRFANDLMTRLPRYWPDNTFDVITIEAAREHLLRHKPRVLYIGLGETDEWGHARRYDLYLDAAHYGDRFLAELWETLQRMPEYRDRTTLLLTTDHGRGTTRADWTDHGKNVPDAEYMWMAAMGPDTPPLGVRENVETTQGQVAATIAGLLGENFCAASVRAAPPLPGVCGPVAEVVAPAAKAKEPVKEPARQAGKEPAKQAGKEPTKESPPKERAFVKRTYTYKTVGPTTIEADVYRADDWQVRPVVVWLHGGALIVGSRAGPPQRLLDLCRSEGFALVSLDYRLAPEVKLPAVVEDVEDAFTWLRGQADKLHLDTTRLVVAGGSAGGYLTLLTGYRVRPRPTALVAYWGYGDVDGDWYTKPSEHYRRQPLVSKEEAERAVGGKVLTGTIGGEQQKARSRYYLYLRQNGLWTKEVTGFDPARDKQQLDRYCGVRNVTSEYPPTMLVHGTEDTDVPYEQSAAMAKELERHKVPHELVTVKGAGHGLSGGDPKLVEDAQQKALAFIRRHLKGEAK